MEINMEHQLSPRITKFNINPCSILVGLHVLMNKLAAKNGERSNFAFSPLSFHSMLSLIALGSEGPTLKQMLTFMGIDGVDELNFLASHLVSSVLLPPENDNDDISHGPIVSFVNGAWLDHRFKLKAPFEQIVRSVYRATAKEVDFLELPDQAREEINKWAEKESRGLIRNLLPPDGIDEETILILTNALYFRGTWSIPFDISKTHQRDFHTLTGSAIQVPFMATDANQKHLYASSNDHQVVKMPYQTGSDHDSRRFSMCFFLPNARDGLAGLLDRIRAEPMMLNPQVAERVVSPVWIPRFKFEFEVEASSSMMELGLVLPFCDMYGLNGMVEIADEPVVLSKVFHKTMIEVNEEGTEAAGSSAGRIRGLRCRSAAPPSFVADHPFVFTIVEENSGSVLFLGALLNPLLVS
ncbi:unnamed protein product [Linum tenue]|uniref:Serpin domain-containing protein n=1 Tax=Linum tenue TaxID=586396 RepID=A0AAV0N7U0_9ROSI|nr:unnamed protein product [Linum tenue]